MNKRLRKKLHKGEFQELCFEVTWKIKDESNVDQVLDDFIEFVESIKLGCGGGCSKNGFSLGVSYLGRGTVTPEQRNQVQNWLLNDPRIFCVWLGPLRDAWYGW